VRCYIIVKKVQVDHVPESGMGPKPKDGLEFTPHDTMALLLHPYKLQNDVDVEAPVKARNTMLGIHLFNAILVGVNTH
jgi:hypothetical protein